MGHEIHRSGAPPSLVLEDGFEIVHAACGWDVYAPAPDLADLSDELLELLPNPGAPCRGPWFAWADTEAEALEKIERERRLRLFSSK